MTQYSGVYTLQTQGQALTSGQWATDPYYKNTTLLLHADGVVGGAQNNTFLDSGPNGVAVTRVGTPTQGTFTPYGPTWSNYIGGSGNYLSTPNGTAISLTTGDWTIEGWVNPTDASSYGCVYANGWPIQIYVHSNTIEVYVSSNNGGSYILSGTTGPASSVAAGVWSHFALVKNGNTYTVYVNGIGGTPVTSATAVAASTETNTIIGLFGPTGSYPYSGYISNLRLLKGTAQYTSNFAPPTAPLTAITNTVLLTCQSNRFVDNTLTSAQMYYQASATSTAAFSSTNSLGYLPVVGSSKQLYDLDLGANVTSFDAIYTYTFSGVSILVSADGTSWTTLYASGSQANSTLTNGGTPFRYVRWWYSGGAWNFGLSNRAITPTGSPSTQRFSPFAPQYQYTPAVIGGSGYFGTDNYLSVPGVGTMSSGTEFCIEMWIYPTSYRAGEMRLWGGGVNNPLLQFSSNTTLQFFVNNSLICAYSATFQTNTWYHIAVTRTTGNTTYMYVNGNNVASGANSYSIPNDTFLIGSQTTSTSIGLIGYMTDFRAVVGSIVYSTSFTPPTAPLTAITNTTILCNMTNAGVIDNSMMNDWETVSNAKVSTSVYKYGSGSLYFDGSSYLLRANSDLYAFGTGDFTIEAWIYPTSTTSYRTIFTTRAGTPSSAIFFGLDNGSLYPVLFTSSAVVTSTIPVALGGWTHVALVRSSGVSSIYVNGVSGGSAANSTSYTQTACVVGYEYSTTQYPWYGYIDDLRITKGVARYTGNFQPPKVAFANQ